LFALAGGAGLVLAIAGPAPAGDKRGAASPSAPAVEFTAWYYRADDQGREGYFVRQGDAWLEMKEGRRFATFQETQRTAEFVELYDAGRQMWLRLYAGRALWKQRDTAWFRLPFDGTALTAKTIDQIPLEAELGPPPRAPSAVPDYPLPPVPHPSAPR
jgi:hypothetical protein